MRKPTVIMDFDGVIHSYKSGWKGANIIPDPPVDGIKEAIEELREDYRVVVVSTRCYQLGGTEAIKKWLDKWGIVVDDVTYKKPPAVVIIDDRAITFDGDTKSLKAKVDSFKTWQERE